MTVKKYSQLNLTIDQVRLISRAFLNARKRLDIWYPIKSSVVKTEYGGDMYLGRKKVGIFRIINNKSIVIDTFPPDKDWYFSDDD